MKILLSIMQREVGRLWRNPIYLFTMVLFPIVVVLFFTTMMDAGQPTELPVGVVDQDNTATTRKLVRRLDAFQTSHVVGHYTTVDDARHAVQRGEIYGFIHFPSRMTADLLAGRQPEVAYYYTNTTYAAGSFVFRDMKTIATLAGAAVGQAKLSATGKTAQEIRAFLQPIAIDLHPLVNSVVNYNYYLSTAMVPGCIMLFIFLVTAYSIGTELKDGSAQQWLAMSGNRMWLSLLGKLMPQAIVFLLITYGYLFYANAALGFPMQGHVCHLLLLGLLAVVSAQGFGAFMFGLMPTLRMSMSICALWAALSFSLMGTSFPLSAMDAPIVGIAQLFPLRHYFMIYQATVQSAFPLAYAWPHIAALMAFAALPLLVLPRMKKALLTWEYIP